MPRRYLSHRRASFCMVIIKYHSVLFFLTLEPHTDLLPALCRNIKIRPIASKLEIKTQHDDKRQQPNYLPAASNTPVTATIHLLLKSPLSEHSGGRRPMEAILGSGSSKSWRGRSGLIA